VLDKTCSLPVSFAVQIIYGIDRMTIMIMAIMDKEYAIFCGDSSTSCWSTWKTSRIRCIAVKRKTFAFLYNQI